MTLEQYQSVQSIAKHVHNELGQFITRASTEHSIAATCIELLAEQGINDTWYHGVPAFVLLGSRSCLSISGRDYIPANEEVGESNVVTVDLSPLLEGVWGDCARTYCIEDGEYTPRPEGDIFCNGLFTEYTLHSLMRNFVTPETRFQELFTFGNEQIHKLGFDNLDFLKNLGHSIEIDLADRRYIDENCDTKLGEVSYFTFEPHIGKKGSAWGFKHENIYYFDSYGVVQEL